MTPTLAPAVPDRPYPGIEAFSYADHPVFFAREQEAEKLLRMVTIYRSVLVFGRSGSGKSSLINAGFLPRALDEGLTPDRIRLQPRYGQEIIIERTARNANGQPPFLPSSFAADDGGSHRMVMSIPEFRLAAKTQRAGNSLPVLIFDQFEEFISLFEEALRADSLQVARRIQADLLDLLVSLHREADLRVKLLFVFREDYLAKLGKLFNRCPDLRDTFLHLTAPRPAALEQIILGPFRRFPGRFGHEFPENLARRLQFALEERSDLSEVNLSEVQIICQRLWQSNDQEREFAAKGLQGLLEDYLSESLGRLSHDLRDPAVAILSRMVTAEGLRNVISEEDLVARVVNEERLRREKVETALASLVSATRLVRRERREDVVFFEIVSEFLSPWIRRQKALRRTRALRRRWIAAAAVLLCIALASVGTAIWILGKRTESAIARDEVRRALAAEAIARRAAEADARARLEAEGRFVDAERARQATAAALQQARNVPGMTQPQLDLQAKVDELTRELVRLRAENARLAQGAKQRPEVTPAGKAAASPVAIFALKTGMLTLYTASPFDAGLGIFLAESEAEKTPRSGFLLLATSERADAWPENLGRISEHLRKAAGRLLRSSRGAADLNRMKVEIRRALPDVSAIRSRLLSTGGPAAKEGASYVIPFDSGGLSYEARVESRGPDRAQVTIVRAN